MSGRLFGGCKRLREAQSEKLVKYMHGAYISFADARENRVFKEIE